VTVQIVKHLGTGAQGCTYLVKRVDNNQLCALKMVMPSSCLSSALKWNCTDYRILFMYGSVHMLVCVHM